MNKKKTKIMCNEVVNGRPRQEISKDNERLEEVEEYRYLGGLITPENEISKEIDQRIIAGWRRGERRSLESKPNQRKVAGHVARMDNNRWTKKTREWVPREGRRSRGRPKKRWSDAIAEKVGATWMRQVQETAVA
nr:uncharacterized protein LOC113818222 [Penaeus vannamei]